MEHSKATQYAGWMLLTNFTLCVVRLLDANRLWAVNIPLKVTVMILMILRPRVLIALLCKGKIRERKLTEVIIGCFHLHHRGWWGLQSVCGVSEICVAHFMSERGQQHKVRDAYAENVFQFLAFRCCGC